MRVKQRHRGVDRKSVVGLVLRKWAAALAVLAALCWLLPPTLMGADPRGDDADEDDPPVDVNVIRMKAEAGNVMSQTMLADWFAGAADFTNAVVWYRKAAEQGSVSAQLSLASLLITGRGTAKNPQEAAKWLRLAANGIESPASVPRAVTTAPAAAPNRNPATNAALAIAKSAMPSTNSSITAPQPLVSPARIQRATALQVPEPALQDAPPTLRPPPETR